MQYHYFQVYTIMICLPIMAFKVEGKEMYPIIVFTMCCWSVHSQVVRLSKHAHSKQKNHSHTTSAVSCQVYVHALLVQHL